MLYYAENLTKQSMKLGVPWECLPPDIEDKVRTIKEERQKWYQNPLTKHWFYSGYEALNPNARVTKDNPAHTLRALVADLDPLRPMSREEVDKIVADLPIKPTHLEKSLGNGWRLVWMLVDPVLWCQDKQLVETCLTKFRHSLGLMEVKCLDEGSWFTPHRLYCNGGEWHVVSEEGLEKGFVEQVIFTSAMDLAKRSKASEIALPRVEELIRKKWPDWDWPGEFTEGSQGPSWWIEGSESPKSAIVHADGMWTFAGHREHDKYTWPMILGQGVIEEDRADKINKACEDTYHDGKNYYITRPEGGFYAERHDVIRRRLTVAKGLYADRAKKQKNSEVDEALTFIESSHRVDAAAPLLFRPVGIVNINGKKYLNMSFVKPTLPVEEAQVWSPDGTFPFIVDWLTKIFVNETQLTHFLSWLASAYQGAISGNPHQGQASFFCGGVGIGKTLLGQRLVGPLMGGFADAGEFLMNKDAFGGELFQKPIWAVDDQIMVTDPNVLRVFTSFVKKHVANMTFTFHEKYMKKMEVEWLGRLFITCNLDAWSQTILPALEDSVSDKVNFYKMVAELPKGYFPKDIEELLLRELPFFAAYLRDFVIPEELVGDARFRVIHYQEESLASNAYHNSGSSGNMEVVYEFLKFQSGIDDRVKENGWVGNATQLIGAIRAIPSLEGHVRSMSSRQMNIHLSTLMSLKGLKAIEIEETKNAVNVRVWTIKFKKS
jgi:hypothetical protein